MSQHLFINTSRNVGRMFSLGSKMLGVSRTQIRHGCSGGMWHQQQQETLFVGKPAPTFTSTALMPDSSKGQLSLDAFKGKYLVLFFYPLDFTFVCPTEIIAYSDRVAEFEKLNCKVVAASCDSFFSHLAWSERERKAGGLGKLNIPIIADKSMALAKKYNVLIEDEGFPHRGLFIIDGKGVLRHVTINDTGVGRSVDETLRLVQAFQFHDANGEVCPANWKPGQPTLNPAKPDEFFKNQS